MNKAFHSTKVRVRTGSKTDLVDITPQVQQAVADSGVQEGLCIILHIHSTGGLILNSIGDPATRQDLVEEIDRLVPTRVDFRHQFDTPRDASGHVKAMLVGHSVMMAIEGGQLPLGRSSGVLFCDFDGPRDRTVTVQIWSAE
jgi:secondary thiamine-phosphate synthase enzyme